MTIHDPRPNPIWSRGPENTVEPATRANRTINIRGGNGMSQMSRDFPVWSRLPTTKGEYGRFKVEQNRLLILGPRYCNVNAESSCTLWLFSNHSTVISCRGLFSSRKPLDSCYSD